MSLSLSQRDTYRGWEITPDYWGWSAIGPNYDVWYEDAEIGWIDNGHIVRSSTRLGVIEEIDIWFDENHQSSISESIKKP